MADYTLPGYKVNSLSGAGTTLIADHPAVLVSVYEPAGTAAGTLDLYNVGIASGTASGNLVMNRPHTVGAGVDVFMYQFDKGIVAVTSGAGTIMVSHQ